MKKISIIALAMAMTVLLGTVKVAAEEPKEDLTVSAGCCSLLAQVPIGGSEQKLETAKAAILYELNTGTLVYSYNPDMQVNPTGLVKLLTALVALEYGDLDDEVTVYATTLNTVAIGSVSAGLKAGEVLTLRDLLYCVMVASANDAAAVIAAHIGGNQAGFVQMLNAKAVALGCTGSHFANAHGLKDENQYSTARDLAIITEAALKNETFVKMFETKSYTVPATNKSEARVLNSTNHMMSDAVIQTEIDERVTGGKPAAASNTDRSMICTAEVGSSKYLCIVMSAAAEVSADGLSVTRWNIFEEVSFLLDYGFANFAVRQVINREQAMYQYMVADGDSDIVLHPQESVSVVLPLGFSQDDLHFYNVADARLLQAPLQKGQVIGYLQVQYGSVYIASCSLVAMNSVAVEGETIRDAQRLPLEQQHEEAGFDWRPVLVWTGVALGGAAVLAGVVLITIHAARNARLRAQHRRRARERRRSRR